MKTRYTCFVSMMSIACWVMSFTMPAQAQEKIEVQTTIAKMSKDTQPGYTVDIPQARLKTVQRNWIRKVHEGTGIKVKSSGHEQVLEKVVKPEFMPDTINIYSLFIDRGNRISMYFFLEKDSIFFSPSEDKTLLATDKIDNSIKNYLREFAAGQYRIAVEDELAKEQKILSDLERELADLQGKEDKLKRSVSSKENSIESEERNIADIDLAIDMKNQELLAHSLAMQEITGETDRDMALDKKKELEKEKKKLAKERMSSKKHISTEKTGIEKNNKSIEALHRKQELKQNEISARQDIIAQVQTKLNGIK